MALSLGTLNVTLRANSRQFTATLRAAQKTVRDWSRATDSSIGRVRRQFRAWGRELRTLAIRLDAVRSNFTRLVNKLRALSFLVGVVAAAVQALTDELVALAATAGGAFVNIQLEPLRDRLRSLGLETVQVRRRLDELTRIASRTGTNLLSIAEGAGDFVAAFRAAGGTLDEAMQVVEGFSAAAATMGQGSKEINASLENLAELAREGSMTMSDLRDAVSFTNDPLRTLADAFGKTRLEIEALLDSEAQLSTGRLLELAAELESQATSADRLSNAFNRLVNRLTEAFRLFNRLGVIDALKEQFEALERFLRTQQASDFIERLSRASVRLISETLPNLARATIENWEKIKSTISGVIGFLIGTAAGGLPGGVIGALIGATGQLGTIFRGLRDIISTLSPAFNALGKMLGMVVEGWKRIINWTAAGARALGRFAARFVAGPAGLEARLESAREKFNALRDRATQMARTFEDIESRGQEAPQLLVDRFEALREKLVEAGMRVERFEALLKGLKGTSDDTGESIEDLLRKAKERDKQQTESFGLLNFNPFNFIGSVGDGEDVDPRQRRRFRGDAGSRQPRPTRRQMLEKRLERLARQTDLSFEAAKRLQEAAFGIGDAFEDSFTRAIIEGEKLSDVLTSLGRDIARIVLRQGVSRPLGNLIAGLAGDLFISGTTGGGTPIGAPRPGASFKPGDGMAAGGIARSPSIVGEAGPEAAVPLPDGRSIPVDMRGGGTQVVINDQRGADAPDLEVGESQGPDGRRFLEVTVRDTVARQIERGEFDAPMRHRFGAGVKTRGR